MSRFPEFGTNIYPSTTGRRQNRIGVTSFRRCKQCGYVNDTGSTAWSLNGDGLVGGRGNENSPGEQSVGSGCAFCGSLNWQDHKPTVPPNDERLPTPNLSVRNRRRR